MKQKWESRYCSFWVNSLCYIYYIIKGRICYNFMRLLITSAPKQIALPFQKELNVANEGSSIHHSC